MPTSLTHRKGGHTDLPVYNEAELRLAEGLGLDFFPTYEDVLSGRGIERLYRYFQQTEFPNVEPNLVSKEISNRKESCPCSKKALEQFMLFYARCARNFAVEILAQGGIYLAGGIGAKNPELFGKRFVDEFTRHPLPKYRTLLENTPVYLIKNYAISLKGAAFALVANHYVELKK